MRYWLRELSRESPEASPYYEDAPTVILTGRWVWLWNLKLHRWAVVTDCPSLATALARPGAHLQKISRRTACGKVGFGNLALARLADGLRLGWLRNFLQGETDLESYENESHEPPRLGNLQLVEEEEDA